MWKPRWLLALPLALAATAAPASAGAASVRDQANLFSADAVRQAEAALDRVERENQVPVIIETIPTLNGESIEDASLTRAERAESKGIYILIAKQEHKIYERVSRTFRRAIDSDRARTIREAFQSGLKKGDFDAGLLQGVKAITTEVSAARSELRAAAPVAAPGRRAPMPPPARGANPGGFGLSSLLGIGLLIVGVLFLFRLLGSLFRGGGGYAPGPMGGRPGYGAPGYGGGGGGGGFMSSLFGGIGGAMAGNWLYDQFSGRHHGGTADSSTYGGADAGSAPQGDEWGGGTGTGGDWGGGGGDTGGGGDWGGGGGGGGGDWGGGGGGDIGGGGGGDW